MNRICTNKEQSSRLLEAGVRPDTADMVLLYVDDEGNIAPWEDIRKDGKGRFFYNVYGETYTLTETILLRDSQYYDRSYQDDCPAWSLSKLIDMMPPAIDRLGTLYLCAGLNAETYNADNRVKDHQYNIEYGVNYTLHRYDDPIEASIEAIEWLIKKGYLDNKYLAVKCGDCLLIEDEDASGDAWCAFRQKLVRCDSRACEDISKKGVQNA